MAAHTPGPWSFGANETGANKADICTIFGVSTLATEDGKGQRWAYISASKPLYEVSREEQDANGLLIAAAPELLAALQVVRMSAGWSIMSDETRALVIAALAKAEGRA